MAGTRKARVPMAEQIRLINECRQSGMTDADWCRENDIAVSTFYNWVSCCRKAAADQIPAANYGHLEVLRQKQDVVPIDIVPDCIPEQHIASQMLNSHLDNSHTIEVAMKDITVRISNDADPVLLTRKYFVCFRSSHVRGMVEMAKAHGLNIYGYLKFLLEHRPSEDMTDEQLTGLAP